MQQWVRWVRTYGMVDEVRYNGLHQLLIPPVADQSDQHLKQLTYQALKVHVVPILVCLHIFTTPMAFRFLLAPIKSPTVAPRHDPLVPILHHMIPFVMHLGG